MQSTGNKNNSSYKSSKKQKKNAANSQSSGQFAQQPQFNQATQFQAQPQFSQQMPQGQNIMNQQQLQQMQAQVMARHQAMTPQEQEDFLKFASLTIQSRMQQTHQPNARTQNQQLQQRMPNQTAYQSQQMPMPSNQPQMANNLAPSQQQQSTFLMPQPIHQRPSSDQNSLSQMPPAAYPTNMSSQFMQVQNPEIDRQQNTQEETKDQNKQTSKGKKDTGPIIIPNSFRNAKEYCDLLVRILTRERDLEREQYDKEEEHMDIKFTFKDRRQITCALVLEFQKSSLPINLREFANVMITIPTNDDDILKKYTGCGVVKKINIDARQKKIFVTVDINIVAPNLQGDGNQKTQPLPDTDRQYKDTLNLKVLFDERPMNKQINMIKQKLSDKLNKKNTKNQFVDKSLQFMIDIVYSGKPKKGFNEIVNPIFGELGMVQYNQSQATAITKAITERLSVIQGPPGTGKTKVLCGIVSNWVNHNKSDKILVCASSNYAADLIAEELYKVAMLQQRVVRVYSSAREDIFNIKPNELKPYSLMHKMIYSDAAKASTAYHYIEEEHSDKRFRAKFQIEYYFGGNNYYDDHYLLSCRDEQGYVLIDELQRFQRMKMIGALDREVAEAVETSTVVELSSDKLAIRKKETQVNDKITFLGFDKSGIRNLTPKQFNEFVELKERIESVILEHMSQVIVTTCQNANTSRLRSQNFRRVIIDEATQAKEADTLLCCLQANQLVLVGDQMQLSHNYLFDLKGPFSMFDRLIKNNYPSTVLDVSYRLHPALLEVPNILCYENKIQSGYKYEEANKFLHKDNPFIFIDVQGKHTKSGTSAYNIEEAQVAVKFLVHLLKNEQVEARKVHFLTPYQAQCSVLRTELVKNDLEMESQVSTIDSSQGREYDYVFVSMVSSSCKHSGFCQDLRRINVALTRAKHGLVIIGDAKGLSNFKDWKKLVEVKKDQHVQGLEAACNLADEYKRQDIEEQNREPDLEEDFM